ncbi:uncharacterized protein JCM15063_004274 [Sporobolomyces koalae]|uniref:uncharacterized protein n=1 Tax=Sporobolomyces koalae TaxID=500713 RepID=UPI003175F75F
MKSRQAGQVWQSRLVTEKTEPACSIPVFGFNHFDDSRALQRLSDVADHTSEADGEDAMALGPNAFADKLLDALPDLPAGENPYHFLSQQLTAQLLPTLPPSAAGQLYFLAALYGLAGILIFISQCIRFRKGIVWLYRWQSEYRIIRPHATLSWTTLALPVVALFEILIARILQLAQGHPKRDFGYFLLLVWGSAWIAGAVATWSFVASFIVHLHTSGSRQPPSLKWSFVTNAVGIGAPVVYSSILLTLGILAGRRYHDGQTTLDDINTILAEAAQNWTPDATNLTNELAPVLPLLNVLVEQISQFVRWWRAVFLFYLITALLLLVCIGPVSYFYLTNLKRTMNRTSREIHETSLGTNRPRRQIQHTWWFLVSLGTVFSLLATMFFVISLFAYLEPYSMRNARTFQGIIFTPLWSFGTLGFLCAVLLVFRAIEAQEVEDKRNRRNKANGKGSSDDTTSGCWSAIWSGSGVGGGTSRSSQPQIRPETKEQVNTKEVAGSPVVSLRDLLTRRFRGPTESGIDEDAATRSVGIGSSVVVRVEVEVSEDTGQDDDDDEKVIKPVDRLRYKEAVP